MLSRDEVQAMEDAAQTERDKIIVRTLADTGVRVGELGRSGRPISRSRAATSTPRSAGKGRANGSWPLPPALYWRLRRYADRSRPDDTSSDRLFLALRRSPLGTFDALTTSGVSQLLRILALTAGIKKRVHPHLLWHSFAMWALTRCMNPLTLSQILAHSSLVMIHYVYAHLTPADSYDALLKILERDWTCDTPSRILPVGRPPCSQ